MTARGINTTAFAELCLILNKKAPKTREELAHAVGITFGTTIKWLFLLRARKLIYISGYKRSGNGWAEQFNWGYNHIDELRPRPLTQAEHCRNYRNKQRKLNESHEQTSSRSSSVSR